MKRLHNDLRNGFRIPIYYVFILQIYKMSKCSDVFDVLKMPTDTLKGIAKIKLTCACGPPGRPGGPGSP